MTVGAAPLSVLKRYIENQAEVELAAHPALLGSRRSDFTSRLHPCWLGTGYGWSTCRQSDRIIFYISDVENAAKPPSTMQLWIFYLNKFNRLLEFPGKSFFLLGPRGTGKSTWLAMNATPRLNIDLLHSEQFYRYQARPSLLREDVAHLLPGDWIVIDEAQRVPDLLHEVHSLYETKGLQFALTGSSARKLKRADANMLAGRALRCDFFPLTWAEMGDDAMQDLCLDYGSLPHVVTAPKFAPDTLASYVQTYLKEEVAAEALTRSLEPFARFLQVAAQRHGQLLNVESVAQEAAVKRRSVDNYFSILEDTLLGFRLPALRLGRRAKEVAHPKFYFFDAGVARAAAGWLRETMPDAWRGFSLETLVLNEIRAYNSYRRKDRNIYHYSVTGSLDVDFIVETAKKVMHSPAAYLAIEVKLAKKWQRSWSHALTSFCTGSEARIAKAYGIYLGADTISDGPVEVMNLNEFSRRLWEGRIF